MKNNHIKIFINETHMISLNKKNIQSTGDWQYRAKGSSGLAATRASLALIVLSLLSGCIAKVEDKRSEDIPFQASLHEADVSLTQMQDGQRESLIFGNGDLYGIVWAKDNNLFMRITKNDIWDARVNTSKDGELPGVDITTHKISGPVGAPPGYALPYPQPRCAAALQLGTAPKAMSAHLDIEKALITIKSDSNLNSELRILHDKNVLLVKSPNAVTLEAIKAESLPDATLGTSDDVSWLIMKMPGDIDYEGMDYVLAVASRGELKAISLVTSFDTKGADVLEHAIELAKQTIAEDEETLISDHERAWQKFWSRSGVQLEDKVLQRWWYRMLYFAHTVSKPGAAPVGLLPPLATDKTPWHADYHHNYNTWQAYWPLPAANHPELADPWISYNNDMIPRYKYLARETYGIDGLHVPISSFLHEPDPASCKSKNKRQMSMNPWGLTIGLPGMTLQSMWQKYLCDQDVDYMRGKIYPFVKEAARFYLSFMEKCQKDDNGKILLGPSFSPEHGTFMPEMIGIAALINEFMLQSVQNRIRLFPCWPVDMDAKFYQLRAQGGFIVSAAFKEGKVASATIESVSGNRLQLLSPWKTIYINSKEATIDDDGIVTIVTKPSQVFQFSETSKKNH